MRLLAALRALPHQAVGAFTRTPLEVLLGAVAWLGLAVAIERSSVDDVWPHLTVAIGIALPLVYATSLLFAAGALERWTRWLFAGVVVTGAVLYGFLRFDPDLVAEGWRAALLITASVLALLTVPLLSPVADRRAHVHLFTMRLAVRVVLVGLYALALFAGLAAALGAVNGLFALKLPDRVYGHLAALIFVFLPPWAIAAGLPELIAAPAPWGAATLRALRRTALFLLVPLIAVYLAIVYAYAVRMFVTGEVPSNLISPVVLGAGILTFAATLLLEPLHGRDDVVGLSRFVRLLPALLVPLIGLALWAVLIRVHQHGWTEFRYLRTLALLLLGGFGIAGSWRLFRRLLPPLAALPAVAAVVVALAAVGPLSAPAVSYRSQQTRLAALLTATDQPEGAQTTAPATAAPQATTAATDTATQPATPQLHTITPSATPQLRTTTQPLAPSLGTATQPGAPQMTTTTTTTAPTPVTPEAFAEILSRARYLRSHFGWDALTPFVLPGATEPENRANDHLAAALGIVEKIDTALPRLVRAELPDETGISGVMAGTLYPVVYQRIGRQGQRSAGEGLQSRLEGDDARVIIQAPGGPPLAAELAALVQHLTANARDEAGEQIFLAGETDSPAPITARSVQTTLPPELAALPLTDPDGRLRGQLLIRTLNLRATGDTTLLEAWSGFVLLLP